MNQTVNGQRSTVNLIECPRDAMQGWKNFIPTADKIRYINSLLQAGFDTIDFGSFVSAKAIPQMADTREVLAESGFSTAERGAAGYPRASVKTRSALAILVVIVFIDLLGFGMVIPVMPLYAERLGASEAWLGILSAVYALMQFVFSPIWGRFSDRIGRRPVLLVSIAMTVLPVLRSPMMSSRWPRPTGIIASMALMPVCSG